MKEPLGGAHEKQLEWLELEGKQGWVRFEEVGLEPLGWLRLKVTHPDHGRVVLGRAVVRVDSSAADLKKLAARRTGLKEEHMVLVKRVTMQQHLLMEASATQPHSWLRAAEDDTVKDLGYDDLGDIHFTYVADANNDLFSQRKTEDNKKHCCDDNNDKNTPRWHEEDNLRCKEITISS